MQKIWKIFFLAIALLLAACGGGGGSPGENISGTIPLQVNVPAGENPVRIQAGQARLFKITGGRLRGAAGGTTRSYQVFVKESGVVGLSWAKSGDDDSTDAFVVQWLSGPAETTVTVSDADNKEISFRVRTDPPQPVAQALYTTSPDAITVALGDTRTFVVGGGTPPYTVESANNVVATASTVGTGQWRVTGVAVGDAAIKIRDAAGAVLGVAVKVQGPTATPLTVSPDAITVPIGIAANVKISGGQPPYRIAGGIPAAVQVTLSNDEVKIVGTLVSTLDVTVLDAAGNTAKVAVTVNAVTPGIRFSPSALTVSEYDNSTLALTVFEAVGDICVFSSDPTLLQPATAGCTANRTVSLVNGTRGNRCVDADSTVLITVVDSTRATAQASITVKNNDVVGSSTNCRGVFPFTVSPNAVSVRFANATATPPTTATSNDAVLSGGTGPYVVTSSNPGVATATVTGNVVRVTGGNTAPTLAADGVTYLPVFITIRDQADPTNKVANLTVNVTN